MGRGYGIYFWQAIQILHLGFFISKITMQQYRFQAEKESSSTFGG